MAGSPSTKNYTLGKGKLFFDKLNPATGMPVGERNLGNAPSVTFNVAIEALEHYSSTGGLKAKDKKVIAQITPKFNFTLDEVNAENIAMLMMSDSVDVSQAAADDNTAALTGVMPGYYYDLTGRGVGVWAVSYDGGTGAFAAGETLTGGTSAATATIEQVIGDTVSGTLYLTAITGGPFEDGEALTDASSGVAVANGTEMFLDTALSVEDTDNAGTFFEAGTDYLVNSASGTIGIIEGGAIDGTTVTNLTVVYAISAVEYKQIKGLTNTELEGRLRYVSDNPVGNQMEMEVWKVSLIPSGDTALIGDDWSTLTFEGEILKDDVAHPDNPYMNVIVTEAA